MKKNYTKKQITEAIAYWKNQLKLMNEGADRKGNIIRADAGPGGECWVADDEVPVITVDEWNRNKIYPTSTVIKCPPVVKKWLQDFLKANDATCLQYFFNRNGDENWEPYMESVTAFNSGDGKWLEDTFGPGSDW